ncbi:MAG: hypothetical protein ACJ76K_15385 [Solirubrobacteraceae bacterium]
MAHVHAHAPHELTEPPEPAEGRPTRPERALELGAVLLLSFATLATAWSGYQAALWAGKQSQHYAQASTLRIHAQEQSTRGGQLRIDDLLLFNGWLEAHNARNHGLDAIYERRFRPRFVPAFRAWLAERPFTNPRARPSPLYMPQYHPVELARAAALDRRADVRYEEGTAAKENDDKYILSTVFFAAVLFFSGISLRLDWRPLRIAVLVFGATMLLGGFAFVLTLPAE